MNTKSIGLFLLFFYGLMLFSLIAITAAYAEPAVFRADSADLTLPELKIEDPDCGNFSSVLHVDFSHTPYTVEIVKLEKTRETTTHYSPWPPAACRSIGEIKAR